MPENPTLPVYYIPHGGGPCFFMDWNMGPPDTWEKLRNYLSSISQKLPEKPSSVLIVSAHWEEREFSVACKQQPEMFYDYYGFPEHTYRLKYGASGNPILAQKVFELLNSSGLNCVKDLERDFDHGVFIPLMVMFPEAEIPVVMLSLKRGLKPKEHIAAGRALSDLRKEGVLILGSGLNYHNMQGFMNDFALDESKKFNQWLTETVHFSSSERNERLDNWAKAPCAGECHPREEHLIPLMFCSGAAGEDHGELDFSDIIMNAEMCSYKFG